MFEFEDIEVNRRLNMKIKGWENIQHVDDLIITWVDSKLSES